MERFLTHFVLAAIVTGVACQKIQLQAGAAPPANAHSAGLGRPAPKVIQGNELALTRWVGNQTREALKDIEFQFGCVKGRDGKGSGVLVMKIDAGSLTGSAVIENSTITVRFPNGMTYTGTFFGSTIEGVATDGKGAWSFVVRATI